MVMSHAGDGVWIVLEQSELVLGHEWQNLGYLRIDNGVGGLND